MEELERDFITIEDDDGNEYELDIIEYFEHEGEQYAILMDMNQLEESDEDDSSEQEIYVLKVVVDGDYEEFVPADDDKWDALVEKANAVLTNLCSCSDDDCDCDCGCGCEHEHE